MSHERLDQIAGFELGPAKRDQDLEQLRIALVEVVVELEAARPLEAILVDPVV